MGFDKYLVNVSWLAEIVSVFWWMKLDFTSLNGGAVSKIVFWCVCGIIMALVSLFANRQGCAPALLKDWHGASNTSLLALGSGLVLDFR